MEQHFLWLFTGIGLLTLLSQWASWWIKVPPILLLLLTGMLVGPGLHWIEPAKTFGAMFEPMISLSVAVILFEGSLNLTFDDIRGLEGVIRNMLTIGLAASIIMTTLASHWLLGISWPIASLLGTILAITGPTVVLPMLRTIRPNRHLANILRWEGIGSDPIGAILAIITLTCIITFKEHTSTIYLILSICSTLIVGIGFGMAFGYGLGLALQNQWIPDFLHNVATLCIVLIAYTLSSSIKSGTGILTVTLMGLWLANHHKTIAEELLGFKESLSILLISGLFLLISAQMDFSTTAKLLGTAFLLLIILQFIVRPISIIISTWGSSLTLKERFFLSWIAPRGIVSASIAALFIIRLNDLHIAQAPMLLDLTLLIIIGTVLFQSTTAIPLARWLQICDPEPNGILIIGANSVARAIGKALQDQGIQVLLSAMHWDNNKQARMEGLPTYYGNPVSEHADRHLDLIGLGNMFGLSKINDINALAALRYEKEFGSRSVFGMHTDAANTEATHKKHRAAKRLHGQALFNEDLSLDDFAQKLLGGSAIRSTLLTESFNFEQYLSQHCGRAIPLFALTPKGRLQIFGVSHKPHPGSGWTLLSLISPATADHATTG